MEALVEYEYIAEQEDELTIKPGDTIANVIKQEGGWWHGHLNGKNGLFPDNFVKEVKKPGSKSKGGSGHVAELASKLKNRVGTVSPNQSSQSSLETGKRVWRARAVYSYSPENEDELPLEVGDLIDVTKTVEEGWWEGIVNGKRGVFPSNFVDVTEGNSEDEVDKSDEKIIHGKKIRGVGLGNIFSDGPIKLRSTAATLPRKDIPASTPPNLPAKNVQKAKVLYSYEAENEDELTIMEGDIITVLDKNLDDSGWWKGQLGEKIGVFPDNFVQLLSLDELKSRKLPIPAIDHKKKPPLLTKKSLNKDLVLPEEQKQGTVESLDSIEPTSKLANITYGRARAPMRRPPTLSMHKENSVDSTQSSRLSLKSQNTPEEIMPASRIGNRSHPTPDETPPPASRLSMKTLTNSEETPPTRIGGKSHVTPNETPASKFGSRNQSASEESAPARPATRPMPHVSAKSSFPSKSDSLSQNETETKLNSLELDKLKNKFVSRQDYEKLEKEVRELSASLSQLRTQSNKRVLELMNEIDEEKKTRLNLQVEIDRLKKLINS